MSDFSLCPLVAVGLGSSLALSGLFYHLYKDKTEEIRKLKEIPIFRPDQHLVRILKASPHKRLQYVAIEGLVQADGEPLASRFVPRCFGVVQRIVVHENWKVWNSVTRTWNSKEVNKTETNNAVAFSLAPPGASYASELHVKVDAPLDAAGCFLERVHHRSRSAEEGLASAALQGLAGEKPVALVETEEMLRVGTALTGFGEVALEAGHAMRLRAPRDGRRYVLVPGDYRGFMERHERSATMWKLLAAACGGAGASLLAGALYGALGGRDGRRRE